MNSYDPNKIEEAVKSAYDRQDISYDALLASSEWGTLKTLLGEVLSLADKHIGHVKEGDPIMPTLLAKGADDGLNFAAIPELANEDVRIRLAVARMIPEFMKQMETTVGVLIREAWVLEVKGKTLEEMRDVLPSQDDRRVSVVMADLILPTEQLIVNFRIWEKAQRSIDYTPMNVLVAKHDGKMLQPGIPNMGAS